VCRRESYHEKIFAAAEDLVSGGKLVSYARAAKRPLVVFDSYLEGGDLNREVKIGKPLFRCKSGQEPYTALTLKARIEGLPAGKTALISVGDDWYRHTCHREKKTGLHYVTVTLMGDSIPKISILGAGKIQTPIEYPFLRQVALL
jgi:hypothetical protein